MKLGAVLPRRRRGCSLGRDVGVAKLRRKRLLDGRGEGAKARGKAELERRSVERERMDAITNPKENDSNVLF